MTDTILPSNNAPAPPVVQEVRANPIHGHSVHLATLAAKLDGETLVLKGIKGVNDLTKPSQQKVEEPPAANGGENIATEGSEASDSAASSSDETNTVVEEKQAPVEAKPADVKDSAASRLQKSLELQKRADAAAKKAKEEARRLEADRKEAADLKKQAIEDAKKIKDLEKEYKAKLDSLKVNPLQFAQDHGVTGAEVADFVKKGADPNQRAIALIKEDFDNKLAELKAAQEEQFRSIAAAQQAQRQESVNRAFYDYFDSAVKANPESYQAADVVYGREELLQKATEIADEAARLHLDYNPDRLLEEIENRAKADSRWARIQSKFTKTVKENPKVPVKKNPPPEEKPVEEVAKTAPRQRNEDGTFQGRQFSPMERHKLHVDRVLRGVRF